MLVCIFFDVRVNFFDKKTFLYEKNSKFARIV
jgi:hypothetical protein